MLEDLDNGRRHPNTRTTIYSHKLCDRELLDECNNHYSIIIAFAKDVDIFWMERSTLQKDIKTVFTMFNRVDKKEMQGKVEIISKNVIGSK